MRDSLSGYGKYDPNNLSATRLPTNADVSRLLSKNTSHVGRNVISQLYDESANKSKLISTSMNVLGTSVFGQPTDKIEPSFAFFSHENQPLEDTMMSKFLLSTQLTF
jgi:hypothetical protein